MARNYLTVQKRVIRQTGIGYGPRVAGPHFFEDTDPSDTARAIRECGNLAFDERYSAYRASPYLPDATHVIGSW